MKICSFLLSGLVSGQRPIPDGYQVARYRTRYLIKGTVDCFFFKLIVYFYPGFESLEELNQIMTDIEATALTEDSHFKTRYFQMMLSWLMESKGLGSRQCALTDIEKAN